MSPEFPTLEIPLGSLIPEAVDGILAAGRNLSCEPVSHAALREVPECWVMGQGAGVAAALAVRNNVQPRAVSVADVQSRLAAQGAIVRREVTGRAQEPAGAAAR
jgi:hypothetical protein